MLAEIQMQHSHISLIFKKLFHSGLEAVAVAPILLEGISHGVLAEPLQQQHLLLELAVPENFQPS
jgi:hypothetical protein